MARILTLMSEWYDNQKQSSRNFRKLLQERIEKSNQRRELLNCNSYTSVGKTCRVDGELHMHYWGDVSD